MTHLSKSELVRWRDTPVEADRTRIIGHLAVCDQCSAEYAELVRTQPLEQPRPNLDINAFLAAGAARQVSSIDRPERSTGGTLRSAMAAAAVGILALFSWQLFDAARLRGELTRAEAARVAREQESAQQSGAERARNDQLNRELQEERSTRVLLERELARQREPRSDSSAMPNTVISLFLAPGRLRASGETKTATIDSVATNIRLVLDLGTPRSYRSYEIAILDADGAVVWSRSGVSPGDQLVMVNVPAKLLPQDDYEVNLKGVSASGSPERVGDYYFKVLKR